MKFNEKIESREGALQVSGKRNVVEKKEAQPVDDGTRQGVLTVTRTFLLECLHLPADTLILAAQQEFQYDRIELRLYHRSLPPVGECGAPARLNPQHRKNEDGEIVFEDWGA